jgi:hypothetical protein
MASRSRGPPCDRAKLTPPVIARMWGISPEKVLAWIRSGELRAMNAATDPSSRPRYLVAIKDLAAFESRRTIIAPQRRARSRHSTQPTNVIEYF